MRIAALILALLLPALPAAAQAPMGAYYALLSPGDMVNSRGVALADFGAILQQDRANFHRFGRADELDDGDPVFWNAEARAMIPRIWTLGPGSDYIPGWVLSGRTRYVYVQIFGSNGIPTRIVVHEGAG